MTAIQCVLNHTNHAWVGCWQSVVLFGMAIAVMRCLCSAYDQTPPINATTSTEQRFAADNRQQGMPI
jgi:hypothetical protein